MISTSGGLLASRYLVRRLCIASIDRFTTSIVRNPGGSASTTSAASAATLEDLDGADVGVPAGPGLPRGGPSR